MSETRFVSRYQLVRLIGSGSTAEVWEALLVGPHAFRKPVALKLLKPHRLEPWYREAMIREARSGASLHHPNVVATYELGEVDGRLFIAMELIRGCTTARLSLSGPLAPALVLDIGIQACAGLDHIHRQGDLVHRDIKPTNLLVDRGAVVKVADLGISRAAGSGETSGTPGYMSPEQIAGDPVDPRSDVFGLGVTLCALALGERPFGAGRAALPKTLQAEASLERGGVLARLDHLLPGLGDLIGACLRERPDDRWSSARDLARALIALRRAAPAGPRLVDGMDLEDGEDPADRPTILNPAPEAPRQFVGRTSLVADVDRRLGSGRVVTLTGLGGVGKSRVAEEVARRWKERGPVWSFDLAEVETAAQLCFVVARSLGLDLDGADPVATIGSALRARRGWLLVFDNVEQLLPEAAVIARWVTRASDARFLLTSRIPLGLPHEERIPVEAMDLDDGVELFVASAPVATPPHSRAEVAAIVEAVDRLPLAIQLAASRTAGQSLPELRRQIRDALDLPMDPDRPSRQGSLRISLDGSWGLLSARGRAALAQLTVFVGGFSLAAAEATLDLPGGEVGVVDALAELVDASLVRVDGDRFSMLPVVRGYAGQALSPDERKVAEGRHGRFYAQFGAEAAIRALDARGGEGRRSSLKEDADNLAAACWRANLRADSATSAGAALALDALCTRHGPVVAAVEWLVAADALVPERRVEVRTALGRAHGELDRYADARWLLVAAWQEADAGGDEAGAARALAALGSVHLRFDRTDEALTVLEEAAARFSALGDDWGQGLVERKLGVLEWQRGRLDAADSHQAVALRLLRASGCRRGEALVILNLGVLAAERGLLDQAQGYYETALVALEEVGARRKVAVALLNLAQVLVDRGELGLASEAFERGVALNREAGDRRGEAAGLANHANVLSLLGRTDEAVQAYTRAIALDREVGDRRFEAIATGNLGQCLGELGELDRAHQLASEALMIHREIGNRRFEAAANGQLGTILVDQGRLAEGHEALIEALRIAEEVEDRAQQAAWRSWLGLVQALLGNEGPARAHQSDADRILRTDGSLTILIHTLSNRARAEVALGNAAVALAYADEALGMVTRLGWGLDAPAVRQLRGHRAQAEQHLREG